MLAVEILLGLLCASFARSESDPASPFKLTILHTNDVHSHIEESSRYGGICTDDLKKKGECYGGVARIVTKVKELKAQYPGALFMNGGDFYQGTAWYTLLKHNLISLVMENMYYDYVCFGNHEFDDGPAGLAPFLKRMIAANITVVNTNANFSESEDLRNITLPKSVNITINGTKIGIVGAVLHETATLSQPAPVTFENDLDSIKEEAKKLKESGINIVVAITHCGYPRDLQIIEEVLDVDIIVGGHTNTFLYNKNCTKPQDKVEGDYPTVVKRKDGTIGLVVQDFWFGKYLGFLQVEFDADGKVTTYSGNPILLDNKTDEDCKMLEVLKPVKENVTKQISRIIGSTSVELQQNDNLCRLAECNLGDLITDAYYDYYTNGNETPAITATGVDAAIVNGGSIRAPMAVGNITMGSILSTSPFGQSVIVATLNGSQLKDMFEHSVLNYSSTKRMGQFLQVSKQIRVVYNVSKPIRNRVTSLKILQRSSENNEFEDVEDGNIYRIVTTDYVTNGGDGFKKIKNVTQAGPIDFDVLKNYIETKSPINVTTDGRIEIVGNATNVTTQATPKVSVEARYYSPW